MSIDMVGSCMNNYFKRQDQEGGKDVSIDSVRAIGALSDSVILPTVYLIVCQKESW